MSLSVVLNFRNTLSEEEEVLLKTMKTVMFLMHITVMMVMQMMTKVTLKMMMFTHNCHDALMTTIKRTLKVIMNIMEREQ